MNAAAEEQGEHDQTVFHVVDSLAVGGAERMAVDIANGLAARDWQVHVVATRSTGALAGDLDPRIPLHLLNRAHRFDVGGVRRFRTLVRRYHPVLVHAHGWSSLQFSTVGLIPSLKTPCLVFHDHRPAGLTPVGWTYRAAAWPRVRAYVAVDEVLLARAPTTRHRSIRALVPNGSPLERFRRKETYATSDPVRAVMVANLRPQKAHPVFFDALAQLASRGILVQADLLGATDDDAYLAQCQSRLGRLGLRSSVRIAGACGDIGEVLPRYDIGVLSSTSESGPVALIEYLAAGLPFVVTDVGNVARSLPPGLRRWLVPINDPEALADRIEEVLRQSEADRRSDAEDGIRFVHDTYSIDRTVQDVETVYRRLLSR